MIMELTPCDEQTKSHRDRDRSRGVSKISDNKSRCRKRASVIKYDMNLTHYDEQRIYKDRKSGVRI
jgi:hypothetical protein